MSKQEDHRGMFCAKRTTDAKLLRLEMDSYNVPWDTDTRRSLGNKNHNNAINSVLHQKAYGTLRNV